VPEDNITHSPAAQPDRVALRAALDQLRPELELMPPEEISRLPGLDPQAATAIAMGSIGRIAKHREAIGAQFGEEGLRLFDALKTVVYAAEQACIVYGGAETDSDLSELHARTLEDHRLLVTDADALANRGLLDRGRIDAARSILGYRTTVTSTLRLVALKTEHWSVIEGKFPLTKQELDQIEERAQHFLERLNEREHGASRLPALELRTRALSKLSRSYGEVRRMLTYTRWWEEDADEIAPSLWSGRRRVRNTIETNEPVLVTEPVAPIPNTPNNGGGPFTPG
jgi:hypothetical protein